MPDIDLAALLRILTDCIGECYGVGCEWCAYGWTPNEN